MKIFTFTDSYKDTYNIHFSSKTNSLYVYSLDRLPSITDGDMIVYGKTILNCHDKKNLEYHLDSAELVQFILKLLNNKAFW